jgi:hypothetical protein
MHDRFFLMWLTSTLIPGTCGMGRNLGRFSSMFADSSLGTMILRCQIENLAHGLEDRGRLTSCSNGQQHFHGRLEHLIYDATTKRLYNILLVRAEIAQATAHPTNFIAAHGLKTLS